MIGTSKYVGNPAVTMLSNYFGEIVQLHMHSDPWRISSHTEDADVIVTYRTLDDVLFNEDVFVIDIGKDDFYESI